MPFWSCSTSFFVILLRSSIRVPPLMSDASQRDQDANRTHAVALDA